jgi:uncharacterized Zn finger protein (UPF0148 family)
MDQNPLNCPACGAPLVYKSTSWKVTCEYCGYSFNQKQPDGSLPPTPVEAAEPEVFSAPRYPEPIPSTTYDSIPGEDVSSPVAMVNEKVNQALNLTKKWVVGIVLLAVFFCISILCVMVVVLRPIFSK